MSHLLILAPLSIALAACASPQQQTAYCYRIVESVGTEAGGRVLMQCRAHPVAMASSGTKGRDGRALGDNLAGRDHDRYYLALSLTTLLPGSDETTGDVQPGPINQSPTPTPG
jgi:hypothetical protein